jgi:hypothetical protein
MLEQQDIINSDMTTPENNNKIVLLNEAIEDNPR